jgi:carbonic anhydrase/acetyltransferase-like protein (isoleucine patch superfamily)
MPSRQKTEQGVEQMLTGKAYTATGPLVSVHPESFVHPTAQLYGKVILSKGVSVWPNAVVRSEMHSVEIGERTNIQDFVMIHVGLEGGTFVGADCSITHHVTLHGCRLGDRVLIGIGATIMDGCIIGDNVIVAGGSFLRENTVVPANSIVAGVPAKVVGTRDNSVPNLANARAYLANAMAYAENNHRSFGEFSEDS